MSTSDSPNKRAILALKGEEGNDVCADCGRKGKRREPCYYTRTYFYTFTVNFLVTKVGCLCGIPSQYYRCVRV